MGQKLLSGADGKMKRASVPSVAKRLTHNGFGGFESVPESVVVNVPEGLREQGATRLLLQQSRTVATTN